MMAVAFIALYCFVVAVPFALWIVLALNKQPSNELEEQIDRWSQENAT